MNIILLGFPGAGKGTQAQKLQDAYGLRHISTGDLIRAEIEAKTPLGLEARDTIAGGNLVSDEVIIKLLVKNIKDETEGIIFDGFPRTLEQAKALDKYLAQKGQKADFVILLELSGEEVLKRLTSRRVCKKCGAVFNIHDKDFKNACAKCGGELYIRPDDSLESAKHRLEVFRKETKPLIVYYEKATGLKRVDGSKSIDEVFKEISAALGLSK